MMQALETQPALPFRAHTIFGVCEGIGEDFGFNPIYLRVLFAASVLWSPTMAIGAYLVLGLVVLASRLLFPKAERAAPRAVVERAAVADTHAEAQLPLAA